MKCITCKHLTLREGGIPYCGFTKRLILAGRVGISRKKHREIKGVCKDAAHWGEKENWNAE